MNSLYRTIKPGLIVFILLTFHSLVASGQFVQPVSWSYAVHKIDKMDALLLIKATILPGWHIYSTKQQSGGPIKTKFEVVPSKFYKLIGPINEPTPLKVYEDVFNMNVFFFEESVTFRQKIRLSSLETKPTVKGKIHYMACTNSACLPETSIDFKITLK